MNKAQAKKESQTGKFSIGDLRAMIRSARDRGGSSAVNAQFSLQQACDIYERALAGRDDSEMPSGLRPDIYRHGHMKPTKDSFIIQNILRDCA